MPPPNSFQLSRFSPFSSPTFHFASMPLISADDYAAAAIAATIDAIFRH
jgi:hypothetical protein